MWVTNFIYAKIAIFTFKVKAYKYVLFLIGYYYSSYLKICIYVHKLTPNNWLKFPSPIPNLHKSF